MGLSAIQSNPLFDDDRDRDAMVRLCAGQHGAFNELWHRHRQRIFGFLLRRTGSHACADDALQRTFIKVYRYRASYDPGRPFRSWLYRIAANSGTDAVRAQPSMWEPLPQDLVGDGSLERRILARDAIVVALHALQGLDRSILLLTIEGFSSNEIATMLELNANTVRVRLMRARKRLRAARSAP